MIDKTFRTMFYIYAIISALIGIISLNLGFLLDQVLQGIIGAGVMQLLALKYLEISGRRWT